MANAPRDLRFGVLFGLLSASCALLAAAPDTPLPLAAPMGFCAFSFLWVSAAYLTRRPRLLGKRPDGSFAWPCLLGLFPFIALTWSIWRLRRLFERKAPYHEVAHGLWLGRRLGREEPLPRGVTLVVDLTAELPEPRAIRTQQAYLWVPAMDASVPEEGDFHAALDRIAAETGGVYVHCAAGHGRSAALLAAALVARGEESSVDAAERRMQGKRSGVSLNASQRAIVERAARRATQGLS